VQISGLCLKHRHGFPSDSWNSPIIGLKSSFLTIFYSDNIRVRSFVRNSTKLTNGFFIVLVDKAFMVGLKKRVVYR